MFIELIDMLVSGVIFSKNEMFNSVPYERNLNIFNESNKNAFL
jgi:hypothetical protein